MKIIIIEEENHGLIGAVTRKDLILPWLVRNNWINQFTEIYDEETDQLECIKDLFGLAWYQSLVKMDFNKLCECLDGVFYFYEMEIWEG